jgi:hypothetical protein
MATTIIDLDQSEMQEISGGYNELSRGKKSIVQPISPIPMPGFPRIQPVVNPSQMGKQFQPDNVSP